jgi:hypothetical protein
LIGVADPCDDQPCPTGTYDWLDSGFPKDSNGDGLNADCSADAFCDPYTRLPFNDGNALYWALAKFAPNPPAVVTPEGLWITTVQFRAIGTGFAEVRIEERLGDVSETLVAGAGSGGGNVTGTLGPPLTVEIAACSAPAIMAIGPRYLAVTPAPHDDPVALLITGDPESTPAECVSLHVQADGHLGVPPVFQTPAEWGRMHLTGSAILPDTVYQVQARCGVPSGGEIVSEPASTRTWLWGDVNNDGTVFLDDLSLVVSGSQGDFPGDAIRENMDLAPCVPDGVLDQRDIDSVQAAMGGFPFPCTGPCAPGPGLGDVPGFVACLTGPSGGAAVDCFGFDEDNDGDVDLGDFRVFQRVFEEP